MLMHGDNISDCYYCINTYSYRKIIKWVKKIAKQFNFEEVCVRIIASIEILKKIFQSNS